MPQFLTSEPAEALLATLGEALDLADFGIVLLDADLRARFINRSFVEFWAVPPELLTAGMCFRDLLNHAADHAAYTVPQDALAAYVDQREAAVRTASPDPTEIDLRDGRRLLLRCSTLADGGRILTYTDVTQTRTQEDLQHEAERVEADLRFNKETLEDQASYLAALAEDSDANARRAEQAKQQLECEIAERRLMEAELLRLATTDVLTGALNRRQFFALGQQELLHARELDEGLGLLMVDVDHFKAINDRHGHAVGDTALKHIVEQLRDSVRRVDLIGRLGGEEFAILLPGIAADAALKVAERVRARVAAEPLRHDAALIHMTISVGLAMAGETDQTIEQILARADTQLYQAKGSGRNRVCHAEHVVRGYGGMPAIPTTPD